MPTVVGEFSFDGLSGQMTMRYLGPVVRIALDLASAESRPSEELLIQNLERLRIPHKTEVVDLKTPETRFVIVAGNKFGGFTVPSERDGGGKRTLDEARSVLDEIASASPGLVFKNLQVYKFL